MSDNVGSYTDKKGRLVIYNRSDGGGSVSIEKDDVAEVILWLSSFQQGVQPTVATVAPPEVESATRNSG